MESFKDNFSAQSAIYAKYRPQYPQEMFAFLASLTEEHTLAWDCGTGNGQAAIGLSPFFKKLVATDPSAEQVSHAMPAENVFYKTEKAENNSLEDNSVDLVTAANAIHWFDFDVFYKEVKRVLKKTGVIAAWTYGVPNISPGIDEVLQDYHDIVLGEFWLPENRMAEQQYRTLPFPFTEIECPDFVYERRMSVDDVIGFLNTWSATQSFIRKNGFNPTEKIAKKIIGLWGKEQMKLVSWRLIVKAGRI